MKSMGTVSASCLSTGVSDRYDLEKVNLVRQSPVVASKKERSFPPVPQGDLGLSIQDENDFESIDTTSTGSRNTTFENVVANEASPLIGREGFIDSNLVVYTADGPRERISGPCNQLKSILKMPSGRTCHSSLEKEYDPGSPKATTTRRRSKETHSNDSRVATRQGPTLNPSVEASTRARISEEDDLNSQILNQLGQIHVTQKVNANLRRRPGKGPKSLSIYSRPSAMPELDSDVRRYSLKVTCEPEEMWVLSPPRGSTPTRWKALSKTHNSLDEHTVGDAVSGG